MRPPEERRGIHLTSGYRWPEDRVDAAADWLDRYPMPDLSDDQTRLVVDIVGGYHKVGGR